MFNSGISFFLTFIHNVFLYALARYYIVLIYKVLVNDCCVLLDLQIDITICDENHENVRTAITMAVYGKTENFELDINWVEYIASLL